MPGSSPSSRSAKAYQELRNLILSGHFEPNARLTEAELTGRLDVSRGTIRSVLVRLTQEGYVTSEPNRGVRTRVFTIEEAAAVLEAREVLEAALAGKAATHATESELAELAGICRRMSEAEDVRAEAEYSRLNRRFHRHVRTIARQPILSGFVDVLVYPLVMRQFRDLTRTHPRTDSLNEHLAVAAALKTRNPDAAAAAMRHHVASAGRALLLNAKSSEG
ncbi:GntR family transcriptional regulator [Streptomyces tsukubensis]|uniref:GntR family transcriptional regulator n=1 Tax=Streptomyces tsukubensis TaxID=83656 RepID=A0A1V4A3G0_9ACTN|nr:GntR family transcriptional regulator [Streptomyces tsukubensis]